MLKRLELVGFKSFADKTTFDFGPGITAIVGPNGSGKSNVVDAVRWIMGEQSAKSLRGGEMTDVIFNGSASRRSFGMAEVTITLDNSRRHFASESSEIQLSRRVYRSGEGEYLINQHQCRLKDIKDLLLGSGAGADAYCIIAQGKVEVLLQASTKERRTIFEEAAGISRFKVKKIETLRKLERVDQNVQRLRDIIDEVEKQLRSVKLQASKAQRHQEYSGRLKELRVGLGLQDYHEFSEKLQVEIEALDALRAELDKQGTQVRRWEEQQQYLEKLLEQLHREIHQQEETLAHARQQIKTQETTLNYEESLSQDLTGELAKLRHRVNELSVHLSGLAQSLHAIQEEFQRAQSQAEQQQQVVQTLEDGLQRVDQKLTRLHEQVASNKAEHLEQMRKTARLQNDAVTYKAQVDNLQRELARLQQKSEQAAESLASLDSEVQELTEAENSLQDRLAKARGACEAEREVSRRLHQQQTEINELISDLRQQRSGLASRSEVLEGLERSHEGLGSGVGEVLDLLQQSNQNGDADCPWRRCVLGMVADFLNVRREYAPLIDLALGERAQRFLVRDAGQLAEALAEREQPFSSRVGFMPVKRGRMDAGGDGGHSGPGCIEVSVLGYGRVRSTSATIGADAGIVARADQLVTCDRPELADLPKQLLGRTLIVRDLAAARALAPQMKGVRLLTLQGELLDSDGSLTVGTHHAETGILSRKSELREVRELIDSLDRRIADAEMDLVQLRERISTCESRMQSLQQEVQVLSEQAADLRSRLEMQRNRREGLHEEVTLSRDEMERAGQEITSLQQAWRQAQQQADEAEAQVQAIQSWLEESDLHVRQLNKSRQDRHEQWTAAKVALAKIEERVAALRGQYQQQHQELQQRRQEMAQSEQNLQTCRDRSDDSQRKRLHASAQLAHWYVIKEGAERIISARIGQREYHRHERSQLTDQMQGVRGQWQQKQEEFHTHELRANDLRHKRETLADRIREDYELDLAELYSQAAAGGLWLEGPESWLAEDITVIEPDDEADSRDTQPSEVEAFSWTIPTDAKAAHDEIEELRRKLHRLGSVNLDALQELADLETRAAMLNAQYEDLTAAKQSLETIINKINIDSKRLFSETFNTVRSHFQELFRKLFGGGMADVVLEDENDILESGIEIIARPPGKELRSISLLSGGEKTLTAVALLLAIFRSKPSPFCILDEVDAALDEANIGRFADVLHEFLDESHFIIITHSKRTMATADVIYGVTMQESCISKRVAVRLEDYPDDHSPKNGVPVSAATARPTGSPAESS